ncbi:FtsW/RodA/SpoVE family cell cycle protein [Selenomonas sputigena]|uniref:Cell cycle protein n=1 Tax=Selenomonas sputigena (strain ATCC 35185 / DSM 20758 / CCUG 44933 / VPI D19B-28) TaxID=546271 RepID=C9LUJ8_SELS3|nr:FtsW/RodA/SpoVE family cell cycle protein [Selenomonas sputigena]AEC00072.1 cell cycle protein [Selenomonas sputigena ATCC 35185]EEX77431.1 cell cycle protein, FtsW/RodA/SpoVE family [Selenomonas sputigena ATCC 35185]
MKEAKLHLLLPPLGILLLGTGVLLLAHRLTADLLLLPWLAAVIVGAFFTQFILGRRDGTDLTLFPAAMLLASLGLIMIGRLKPALFLTQMRWLLLGLIVYLVLVFLGERFLRLLSYPYLLGVFCLLLLCSALFFGTEIGGSRNWIVFGPFAVQPSEFGKIVIIMFLAAYLTEHREVLTLPRHRLLWLKLPVLRFIAPLLLIWGIAILMFVVQRDLGSALLFFGIAVSMTYMATGRKSYVALAFTFFLGAAALSYSFFSHVRVRFNIWLDPWSDPSGSAYQVVQSLFALGSGGVWGAGFAHGHPNLIPEVHTDFIFAAIAEELGLLGSLGVMLVFALFFYRAIRIALACREETRILLAAGIAVVFLLQAFIIIAGVTKFLPLTGITLPFVSYGGSSMIASFMLLGILTVLSKKENRHG